MNSKESIKLRKRKLPTGNTTLYLDIYRNGKREFADYSISTLCTSSTPSMAEIDLIIPSNSLAECT